ncbi:MAG: hypothetical protein KAT65_01510, partial [Methanophagales archaeon]|nr:hypothetical protein [Methanophagales archaeon]
MLQVDCDVKPEDIQILRNPDAIVGFFAKRGYDTNKRVVHQNPQHLGISNQTLLDQIKRVERISENGLLRVYLIELSSVTVANTLQLARSFKERSGRFILVLTSDYERIDFVFLDRVIPLGKKLEVTTKPRFALRPRSLTVNRSNLDTVSKKVLRRLTFTESDEFAQYEKIRSAYTMADWTEDFFNNRALFSDYFLIHRLKENPVWKEKAESSYLAFKNKLKPFSSQWHNIEEEDFFSNFIEPVLAELGFKFERVHRTAADEVKSHYILLSKSDKKKIGAMLSYRWGRHLDAKDYTRDNQNPEENPSQAVVTVLEEEEVPWVIVTNGKVWRLYSAKTHSRATNYYEIDLEETIALDDPGEAFRYYWVLFREDAFIPRSCEIEGAERKMSFLDKLLYDSQEYSKELEKELKKRVFEEVFPFFA